MSPMRSEELANRSGRSFDLVRFLGAKLWREAEQEALSNASASTNWIDKRYWEDRFKEAFSKCEQYDIPEEDLKICTPDRFWMNVEHLAHNKLHENLSNDEWGYWASILAKAAVAISEVESSRAIQAFH